jgi:hypothetical protein
MAYRAAIDAQPEAGDPARRATHGTWLAGMTDR